LWEKMSLFAYGVMATLPVQTATPAERVLNLALAYKKQEMIS
jgi:hypothetical protein